MQLRRFEILLPLLHNDGSPVDPTAYGQTHRELLERFHGLTIEQHSVRGSWIYDDVEYRDEMSRWSVDVPDTDESRAFFTEFKETLKARFKQIEIWITSYPIERA